MKIRMSKRQLMLRRGERMPEWALADGQGGYASGAADDALFRKHHGYLIVSLKPPVERRLVLAKTSERILTDQGVVSLEAAHFASGRKQTNRHQTAFECDPVPTYRHRFSAGTLVKSIVPIRGHNAVCIRYEIAAEDDLVVEVTPWLNDRDHGDVSRSNADDFTAAIDGSHAVVTHSANPAYRLHLAGGEGSFEKSENRQTGALLYPFEVSTGDLRSDLHFTPLRWKVSVKKGTRKVVDLTVSYGSHLGADGTDPFDSYRRRLDDLVLRANARDWFEDALIRASDMFVAQRKSTGKPTVLAGLPWFTDWGRDTMIAFPGLFLSTRRYAEGRSVLESFLDYQKDGLIPNMFPDDNAEPLYNTVDASLWFVHAGWRYWKETGDDAFVKERLLPSWIDILTHYRNCTRFSIGMDPDGLIHAGSGNDQVTWMDVRINGYAVTPRHGKPVEINALWYNALRVVAETSAAFAFDPEPWTTLANRVQKSFLSRFPSAKGGLKDVVDPDDESIRPNQLVPVILPYTMLSQETMRTIVALVKDKLLDHYAIRSLSYDDPRFKQIHKGPLVLRDHNYHMGTSWGYLIGFYLEAVLIANGHSEASRAEVHAVYERLKTHLFEESLFGVAEIFDGFQGTVTRGCHNQAWSVAEWLRVYKDYQIKSVKP